MLITCTKRYNEFPFAHRQHKHDGSCKFIHGHNWDFEFTFACREKDECGFVIDFGKLKFLNKWLDEHFDHTCAISTNDPALEELQKSDLYQLTLMNDVSSEGIAEFLFLHVEGILATETNGRVFLTKVTVYEDSRNSATYERT